MTLRVRLPGEARSARDARLAVSAWALRRRLESDDLELVTSELVANAASHGSGWVTLELVDGGALIRIRVADTGAAGVPRARPAADDEATGRGLMIVAALTHHWGSHVIDGRTVVWADLPRPRRIDGHAAGPA